MTEAHLHKLHLHLLCKDHAGAIFVMKELQRRFHLSEDYYKCCNYLQMYKIHGETLYGLWKENCQEDYEKFLRYYFLR